jgi:carbon storage regulator
MLVISRKPGERVHIGEDIQVAILEITGSRVVIGIAAPREIAIRRVGPLPFDAEPRAAIGPVIDPVGPPQPEMQFEYRYVDAAELSGPPKRAPVVRIKRSRLKPVPAEVAAATG